MSLSLFSKCMFVQLVFALALLSPYCVDATCTISIVTDGKLTVSIIDSQGAPVKGAKLQIKTWGRTWESTKYAGTSNEKGEVVFNDFTPGYYPAVLVTHPDFAPVLKNFSFEAGQESQVTCKLLKADTGSLRILSPDNKPIAGAMITRLTVSNTNSGNKMVISHRDFEMLTGRPSRDFVSDESGLIELPPLPAGSSVEAEVLHPNWKSTTVAVADIKDLKSTSVLMTPGTIVTAEFVGDESVLKELDGKIVHVRLFTSSLTSADMKYGIIHDFPVKQGAIEFCLANGQYNRFSLSVAGFQVTPSFQSTLKKFEFTDIPETERITKSFVVRKPFPAKGRVVTEKGEPIANATVWVGSQNLYVDEKQELVPVPEYKFTDSIAESDANGNYEIQIPEGPTSISVAWSGYYCEDDQLVANFQSGQKLPDLVLKPLPVVAGKIVDQNGRPLVGAVARVLTYFGDAKYVVADKDGNFEFKIDEFEYDPDTNKRLDMAKILAFDPHSPQANIVDVDLSDRSKFSNVVIELADHEPRWVTDEIGKLAKQQTERIYAQLETSREEIAAGIEKKYPDAKPGSAAPEIAAGTWFNSDSKSLKDFRGQFVLLDFWFIGCGPCEREFPTVKMANDIFGDYGFSVISIHIAGQPPESVKQFCDARGMDFPLVVDSAGEEIIKQYKSLGVVAFPSYLLIDPKGNVACGIFESFAGPDEMPLNIRSHKLELIRYFLLTDGIDQSQTKPNGE